MLGTALSVFLWIIFVNKVRVLHYSVTHYIVFVQNRRGCFGFERCGTEAEEMDFRYDLVEFGWIEQTAAVFTDSGTGTDWFSNVLLARCVTAYCFHLLVPKYYVYTGLRYLNTRYINLVYQVQICQALAVFNVPPVTVHPTLNVVQYIKDEFNV